MTLNLSSVINPVVKFASRNASKLLTGGTIICGAGLVASAIHNTIKAEEKIAITQYTQSDELTTVEKIKIAAPCYWPTFLFFLGVAGCSVSNYKITKNEINALGAALAATTAAFTRYKETAESIMTEDQNAQLKDEIIQQDVNRYQNEEMGSIPEEGCELYWCPYTGDLFELSESQIKQMVIDLNREFAINEYVSLNDERRYLNMPESPLAERIGWVQVMSMPDNHDSEVRWLEPHIEDTVLKSGLRVKLLGWEIDPTTEYMEYVMGLDADPTLYQVPIQPF